MNEDFLRAVTRFLGQTVSGYSFDWTLTLYNGEKTARIYMTCQRCDKRCRVVIPADAGGWHKRKQADLLDALRSGVLAQSHICPPVADLEFEWL